jgi:multiple sugar transport system permease protein
MAVTTLEAGAAAGPRPGRRISDKTIQTTFILPAMILLILWNIFPLFYSLYLSFTQYSVILNAPPKWVGFANFQDVLSDPLIWKYFALTGRYALLSVGLQTIVGFAMAMIVRARFRASGLITTLILIPMMLSPVVVGQFWKMILNPTFGPFNYLLFLPPPKGPDWLGNPDTALWSIVIVDVWMWSPFVMLLCLSGLKAIPDYLYEAAAIDRASSWFQFWRITLPQVAPLLMIAVLFRTIEAFKQFDVVMGTTSGGPGDATELLAVNLYRIAFLGQFNTGKASAFAYIVLIIVVAVSSLYIRYLNRIRGEG